MAIYLDFYIIIVNIKKNHIFMIYILLNEDTNKNLNKTFKFYVENVTNLSKPIDKCNTMNSFTIIRNM